MTDKLPARIADHPTVRKVRGRHTEPPGVIDADWLRTVCLEAGADDVAFASIDNPDLASEWEHVDNALPGTKSYISLVVKMNRDNVRSPARSVANQEFHRTAKSSTRLRTGSRAHSRTPAIAHSTRRRPSPWRWTSFPAASGSSHTSRWP
ncbi:MAG: hypothetical protein QOJ80_4276 [Mycobacterium sp.]|jgi:hypothetical protein|nr:hypothetical protein [Mycobacterium sp.]